MSTAFSGEWAQTLPAWAFVFSKMLAGLLSLAILTFLYKDNPLFRLAESLFAGVSVGYIVGQTYHKDILGQVLNPILKEPDKWTNYHVVIPFLMGLLLFAPFIAPKSGWLISIPFAFYIGRYSGIAIPATIQAFILAQIQGTLKPAYAFTQGKLPLSGLVQSLVIVVGLLAVLAYFYFSAPHKGAFGALGRLGIWFVMVGFGAGFGYTVMARISLLLGRLQFLLRDWLGILPNTG
jgi:hypothetical protein